MTCQSSEANHEIKLLIINNLTSANYYSIFITNQFLTNFSLSFSVL